MPALAKVFSAAIVGLDASPVEVEVDLAKGLHVFSIVGLPDKSVEEAKERVGSAVKNSRLVPPNRTNRRVIVNLAPAELKKEGSKYDLPIAVAYLAASRQLLFEPAEKLFVGELALDGTVRPTSGVLPMTLMAKAQGFKELYVPWNNRGEAALVGGVSVFGVKSLGELVAHLRNDVKLEPAETGNFSSLARAAASEYDFSLIKGQEHVKRALEIAAAGGHNVLMSGPPGAGKTLLARALVSILPAMTWDEFLEVTKIFSVAGLTTDGLAAPASGAWVSSRPFRHPHHSASAPALVGGGTVPKPGEITLAHRGVLFLDEFPEFHRDVLESLRQPLEDGSVSVSRAHGTLTFPAKFMLVATMNPCPCGFLNDLQKQCVCTPYQVDRYRRKLSGPLLDRIDLHVFVPRLKYEKISGEDADEPSESIRSRIEKARQRQEKRFVGLGYSLNSEMKLKHLKKFCEPDEAGRKILRTAMERYNLSARAYHRVLKLARTIADLAADDSLRPDYISEALQFRLHREETA